MKKILVTGANSRFGKILKSLNSKEKFIFRDKKQLNILSLKSIKNNGMKAGVAINPDTDIKVLETYIKEIDLVCVMGVFPGFSGQAFIEATYDRCQAVKELINKHESNTLIEVDGGVTLDNAKKLIECGADILVSGSHVFKADNPKEIISKLKHV